MAPIECMSNQQYDEQRLVDAHDFVCKRLNEVHCGRCLYLGERREKLVFARDMLARHIMAGTTPLHDAWRYIPSL